MRTTAATRLRVGIFVLVALVIGASIAFAIGAQENIFEPKTTYHAIFTDVGGLQRGNTVRVAGVNVGSVTEVLIGEEGSIEVRSQVWFFFNYLRREFEHAHPELTERFVVTSGGAFSQLARDFLESFDGPVLDKPFSELKLLTLVAGAIDDARLSADCRA